MKRPLLLTLRHAARVRTFSFDPSMASVLWLGPTARETSSDAWACVERTERGITLRAVGSALLEVSGRQVGGERTVPITGRELMVGVRIPEGNVRAALFVRPLDEGMARFATYAVGDGTTIRIGRKRESELCYERPFVSGHHAVLECDRGAFVVKDLQSANGTLVNGDVLAPLQPRRLRAGDIVQVLDLTLMVGRGVVCMNHPPSVTFRGGSRLMFARHDAASSHTEDEDGREVPLFYPAPRLTRSSAEVKLEVDAPPMAPEEEPQPVLMQIGPSFLMGMSSMFMAANAVSDVMRGGSVLTNMPSISMAVAMLAGTLVWPVVSRAYERRMRALDELRRGRRYAAYLDGVENRLLEAAASQSEVLAENRLPVRDLLDRADEASPRLMSHARTHGDFLELRVGIGDLMVDAQVTWPQRGFSTQDDMLWERVEALEGNPPLMRDVPLACNLAERFVTGVLGPRDLAWEFVRGLMVQVCARYSYHEAKIVLLAHEWERSEWEFLTSVGHMYEENGEMRLLALTAEGLTRMDRMLEAVLDGRLASSGSMGGAFDVHFVVVCAHDGLAKRSKVVDRLLHGSAGMGFSVVYVGERLSDLPRECGYLIDLNKRVVQEWGIARQPEAGGAQGRRREACMFARADVSATLVEFDPDIMVTPAEARSFALRLGRLRLGTSQDAFAMPETVGFLELFRVGNAAHLNIGQRWAESDPARTLLAPVGIDAQGQAVFLDLHEKSHGPHGLIAGTTGSGKSEFIISYILSLCVGFSPEEVAFVLIDYKGGGLAGAFENDSYCLPHVAGTITNLDGGEVRRALVSIRSELKRRQRLFARACEVSGEATMDIHRYLTLCRQGIVDASLPHLIVVADEFAELKEQEPEFMDELISAARIGRSLGIHLILATQKPTGVVNDQIWANARFKVALKVSDAADSREMIRRDDAALLSRPGAFYLLVGYDELYVGGQAAYAGMAYEPKERFEPRKDTSVELLDAEGVPVAALREPKASLAADTDELHAVLDQIALTAQTKGVRAGRLWLDPLPSSISLEEIDGRYGKAERGGLTCCVGLLDDPEQQDQRRLDLDLAREGNVLLFGAPGSGVDELVRCMLVSLMDTYDSDELWLYAWDGGSGCLVGLEAAPHVGGVVLGSDEERLGNLLRMLEGELARRKSSVGDAKASCDPHIVLVVSNLPALLDLDMAFEDRLISFARDAPRRGMHVLATASTTSGIPLRLQANFHNEVTLWLRDETDYAMLMGGPVDVKPPHKDRRGVAKQGKRVLEFLGASIGADEGRALQERALGWQDAVGTRATAIPMLPAHVTAQDMGGATSRSSVPLGFSKETIQPVFADLSETHVLLVVGNERRAIGSYVRGCLDALSVFCASPGGYAVLDVGGSLGLEGKGSVATSVEEAHEVLASLADGSSELGLLVVGNVVQTLERLAVEDARTLTSHITQGNGVSGPAVVLAAEAWQMTARYEDWARVATSQGLGLWVGDGFADQTILRYSRLKPAYRQHGGVSDGFLVHGAHVEAIRVLEARGGDAL